MAQLKYFEDNLPKIIGAIAVANQEAIVDLNRQRLLDTGLDSKGSLIGNGQYALLTVGLKELKGQETGHFTLFDTGAFHDGMYLKVEGGKLFLLGRDPKTPMLIGEYGPAILGLTETETEFVNRWIIQPEVDNILNEILNMQIEL